MGTFSERMTYLKQTIRDMDSFDKLSKQSSTILFLSLGYRDKCAVVFSANKASFDDAWEALYEQASQYREIDSDLIDYLKIDWVDSQATISIPRFIEILTKTKKNHFRKGISLEPQFKHAFLEQEVNANEMIQYNEKTSRAFLNAQNIKAYIGKNRPGMSRLNLREVDSITVFTTQAVFLEKEQCYPLKKDRFNNGRRDTALTHQHLQEMIVSGMNYLTNSNKKTGKFTYGYYPCADREMETYNMLRHGSALYAMLEAYELFKNENTAQAIKRGLHFLVKHGLFIDDTKHLAYVVDQVGHKSFEVKLGANASAITAIVKYTEVFHDNSYLNIAKMLARGILELQQRQGNFTHVLHFPSFAVKEAFRISNYDSEATLALLRLYGIEPNEEWLQSAEKTLDFFIKNESWKKPDHWLSHCINEMVKYNPSSQYVKFGLKLVGNRLDVIDKQAMIFPTFLEMTLATYKLVLHQKASGNNQLLKEFPEEKLETVIHRRAEYQRNGYFYPELAIYFKNPQNVMGGFFNRYHSFRTRIDDVAYHLAGYCQYYKLFFAEDKPKSEEASEEREKRQEALKPGRLKIGISLGKMADFAKKQAMIIEQPDTREADVDVAEKQPAQSVQLGEEVKVTPALNDEIDGVEPEKEIVSEEVVTDEYPEAADEDAGIEAPDVESGVVFEKEVVVTEDQEVPTEQKVEEEMQTPSAKETSIPHDQQLSEPVDAEKVTETESEMPEDEFAEIGPVPSRPTQGESREDTLLEPEPLVEDSAETEIASKAQVIEDGELEKEETGQDEDSVEIKEVITYDPAEKRASVTERDPPLETKVDSSEKTATEADESVEQSKHGVVDREQTEASNVSEELAINDSKEDENPAFTAQLENQNEEEINAVHQSEKVIFTLTNQVVDFSQRVEVLTNELATLRKQTKELEEKQEAAVEVSATSTQVEELSCQLAEFTSELTTLRNQTEGLEGKQLAVAESAATTNQVEELSRQITELTSELTTLKKQTEELQEKQEFALEASATTEQLDKLSHQLADLTNELATLRSQTEEHEKQAFIKANATKDRALALSEQLVGLTNELTTLKKQTENLEEKQEATIEVSATTSQIDELSRQLAELTNELITLRKQSDELEEKQKAAIEASATTSQVDELSRRLAELTNALTVIKNRFEEHEKQASTETAAKGNQVLALSHRLAELTNQLITLRNQAEEYKKQASRQVAATSDHVLALSGQLAQLTRNLTTLRQQSKELEEKQESAVIEASTTTSQVEELSRQLAELTDGFTTLKNQSEEHEKQASTETAETSKQMEELSRRLEQLTNELTAVGIQSEEHEEQASREVAATGDHVLALTRQLADLTSELATLRQRSKELEEKQEALVVAAATTSQVDELSCRLTQLTNELTNLRKQSEEHKKQASREVAATSDHVLALSGQLAQLTRELTTLRKQTKELDEKQAVLAESAVTTNQVQALIRQLADLTNELKTQRKQVDELEQALVKIEKDREDWILEGLLSVARLKGHAGIPELKDLVREILKQLTAEGLSAEQAQYKKLHEPKPVEPTREAIQQIPEEVEESQQPILEELPEKICEVEEPQQEIEGQQESPPEELSAELEELAEQPEEKISTDPEPIEPDPEVLLDESGQLKPEVDEPLKGQEKPKGLKRIFSFLKKKKKSDQETEDTESDLLSEDVPEQAEKEDLEQTGPEGKTETVEELDKVETTETDLKKTAEVKSKQQEGDLEAEELEKEEEQETSLPPEEEECEQSGATLKENLGAAVEGTEIEAAATATQATQPEEQGRQIPEKEEKSSKEVVPKRIPTKHEKKDSLLTEAIKPEDKVLQTGNLAEIEKLIVELEQSDQSFKKPKSTKKVTKHGEVLEEIDKEQRDSSQPLLEESDEKEFEQEWNSVSEQLFENHREAAATEERFAVSNEARLEQPEAPPVTEILSRKEKKQKRNKFLRALGNILIIFGLVVTAVFAYQVISTKMAEQKALEEAENNLNLKGNPKNVSVDQGDPEAEAKKKEEIIKNYQAELGEAFATVEIPKLKKTLPIIEGTDPDVLDRGVGHLKQSVFPGQNEQIVISGHRDTVFRGFDKLEIGDLFIIRMPYGTYTYKIQETEIVDEDDTSVVRSMGEEVLVVTTCYPFYYIGNAPQRFVFYAYPVENE